MIGSSPNEEVDFEEYLVDCNGGSSDNYYQLNKNLRLEDSFT